MEGSGELLVGHLRGDGLVVVFLNTISGQSGDEIVEVLPNRLLHEQEDLQHNLIRRHVAGLELMGLRIELGSVLRLWVVELGSLRVFEARNAAALKYLAKLTAGTRLVLVSPEG